ncbi:MAG: class I SAM-dependent methyltransferase [Proteobacteria bacterium]|nr:class I SAM-dependent methyltransferase [Pseudomonadota bacterium]
MSGFSASWLALREGADHRSRHDGLAKILASRLAGKDCVRVIDLGAGSGSNLRATAPALGPKQEWVLVDYDRSLIAAAKATLCAWADKGVETGDGLTLEKDGKVISVSFREADLNRELDAVLGIPADLVTASALFDLISERWMQRFARALAAKGCLFYTVLTYDGRDDFAPAHPLDPAVIHAFSLHQKRDKGFGPAAGPDAAEALAEAFRAAGYTVETGDSPWILGAQDNALVGELLGGIAGAVQETGLASKADLDAWLAFRRQAATKEGARLVTGHTDILASPK